MYLNPLIPFQNNNNTLFKSSTGDVQVKQLIVGTILPPFSSNKIILTTYFNLNQTKRKLNILSDLIPWRMFVVDRQACGILEGHQKLICDFIIPIFHELFQLSIYIGLYCFFSCIFSLIRWIYLRKQYYINREITIIK